MEILQRLTQRAFPGATLICSCSPPGGISAQITALEIRLLSGETKRVIVRRHGANDLRRNPGIAADEFRLLETLSAAGLPVPRPYYLDQRGGLLPSPFIVVDYIDGETILTPSDPIDFATQLAEVLARIHKADSTSLGFLPKQEDLVADRLRVTPSERDEAGDVAQIRAILQRGFPFPRANSPVLLHGDYWPGNVLWKDGRLVGVIDWEDAALGDPLSDLGNSRLEILWACGQEAMQRFTDHYLSLTTIDRTGLPYWDLHAALRLITAMGGFGLDEATERTLRDRWQGFVSCAIARLGSI